MKASAYSLLPVIAFVTGWIFGTPVLRPLNSPSSNRMRAPESAGRSDVAQSPANEVPGATAELAQKAVPLVTWREALGYPSEARRLAAFTRLLATLTPAQFAAMHTEMATAVPAPGYRVRALFFRRWAQVAPEAAIDAAAADYRSGNQAGLQAAYMAWGERDFAAAFAKGEALRKEGIDIDYEQLLTFVLPKPGQLPPLEALDRIRELQGKRYPSNEIVEATRAIFSEWAKSEPGTAWRVALAMADDENGKETRECALTAVIDSRVAADPRSAAELIASLPDVSERAALQQTYVSLLFGYSQVRLAKQYALALPDGDARRAALGGLVTRLYDFDKEGAKAFVMGLAASDWRDPTVFRRFLRSWLWDEPERASEVLLAHIPRDAQPSSSQQRDYRQMVLWGSERAPRAMSELALKLPENVRGDALVRVVREWSEQDAVSASEWAAGLPAGDARDEVLQEVANNWAKRGAGDVATWLNTLPDDSGKSAAIEGFARAVISVTPDDALTWLRTIPNEAERMERLNRVWRDWSDRAAAQRWLDSSPGLTPAERAALQRDLP